MRVGIAMSFSGRNGVGGVVSLADPAAVSPINHAGNWGLYGLADQTVPRWGERSLSLFMRAGIQPTDRNLISYHIDGRAGVKGLLPGRSEDLLTFGMAYRRISSSAVGLNYSAQSAPWWTLQADLQHIHHPGGRVSDPANPNQIVKDALVVGVRNTIKF